MVWYGKLSLTACRHDARKYEAAASGAECARHLHAYATLRRVRHQTAAVRVVVVHLDDETHVALHELRHLSVRNVQPDIIHVGTSNAHLKRAETSTHSGSKNPHRCCAHASGWDARTCPSAAARSNFSVAAKSFASLCASSKCATCDRPGPWDSRAPNALKRRQAWAPPPPAAPPRPGAPKAAVRAARADAPARPRPAVAKLHRRPQQQSTRSPRAVHAQSTGSPVNALAGWSVRSMRALLRAAPSAPALTAPWPRRAQA